MVVRHKLADPEIFSEEGKPTPQCVRKHTILPYLYQKLHEIDMNLFPQGGHASLSPPLDPPLE